MAPHHSQHCPGLLQVAHFDIFGQRDCLETDMMYLNGVLPPDVKVQDIQHAQTGEGTSLRVQLLV